MLSRFPSRLDKGPPRLFEALNFFKQGKDLRFLKKYSKRSHSDAYIVKLHTTIVRGASYLYGVVSPQWVREVKTESVESPGLIR